MNNLAFYLSRIYYSLIAAAYPGYDGQSDDYWAVRIYYAVSGQSVTTYADGRDASFFIEKWYRHLIGQPTSPPQGGLDSAVWLQKIWGYYAFGAPDTVYDGRSAEFWANQILALNPTNSPSNVPPVISPGTFSGTVPNLTKSVSDAEAVAYSLGSLAADETVTWTIQSGNAAGKFAINASTGEITLAATLNYWNTASYALVIRATDSGGLYSEVTITVTVTNAYTGNVIQNLLLNELSGTTAFDYSSAGDRDGAYSGVTLNSVDAPESGQRAGQWDGINDFLNLYSAALSAAFNGAAGTISFWFKPDTAYWGDTTTKFIAKLEAPSVNRVTVAKNNAIGQLTWIYQAGGVFVGFTTNSNTFTDWTHVALTWDKAAAAGSGEFKGYVAGLQTGTTQNGLGVFAGSLDSTLCTVGAQNTSAAAPSKGNFYQYRLYNVALPSTQIAKLAAEFDV